MFTLPAIKKLHYRLSAGEAVRYVLSMAEIINLNRARKARAKASAKAEAEANRTRFGRTRAQKLADASEAAKTARLLDDSKRD